MAQNTETFKKLVLDMKKVRHNAQIGSHNVGNVSDIMRNVSHTMQNVGCTMYNVGCDPISVCQRPKGPPRAPPSPIHEKTLVSRNDIKKKKKIKN